MATTKPKSMKRTKRMDNSKLKAIILTDSSLSEGRTGKTLLAKKLGTTKPKSMKRTKRTNNSYKTQVKVVLQGKVETFDEYETRLNKILKDLKCDMGQTIVMPTSASDGRMCSIINYKLFI